MSAAGVSPPPSLTVAVMGDGASIASGSNQVLVSGQNASPRSVLALEKALTLDLRYWHFLGGKLASRSRRVGSGSSRRSRGSAASASAATSGATVDTAVSGAQHQHSRVAALVSEDAITSRGRVRSLGASDDDDDGVGALNPLSLTPADEEAMFKATFFNRDEYRKDRSPRRGHSPRSGRADMPLQVTAATAAGTPSRLAPAMSGDAASTFDPDHARDDHMDDEPGPGSPVRFLDVDDASETADSSDSDDGGAAFELFSPAHSKSTRLQPNDPLHLQGLLKTAKRFVARLKDTVNDVGEELDAFDDQPSVRAIGRLVSSLFRAKLLLPSTEMALDAAEEACDSFKQKYRDLQQRQTLGAAHTTLKGETVALKELRGRLKRLDAVSDRRRLVESAFRGLDTAVEVSDTAMGRLQAALMSQWVMPSVVEDVQTQVKRVESLTAATRRVVETLEARARALAQLSVDGGLGKRGKRGSHTGSTASTAVTDVLLAACMCPQESDATVRLSSLRERLRHTESVALPLVQHLMHVPEAVQLADAVAVSRKRVGECETAQADLRSAMQATATARATVGPFDRRNGDDGEDARSEESGADVDEPSARVQLLRAEVAEEDALQSFVMAVARATPAIEALEHRLAVVAHRYTNPQRSEGAQHPQPTQFPALIGSPPAVARTQDGQLSLSLSLSGTRPSPGTAARHPVVDSSGNAVSALGVSELRKGYKSTVASLVDAPTPRRMPKWQPWSSPIDSPASTRRQRSQLSTTWSTRDAAAALKLGKQAGDGSGGGGSAGDDDLEEEPSSWASRSATLDALLDPLPPVSQLKRMSHRHQSQSSVGKTSSSSGAVPGAGSFGHVNAIQHRFNAEFAFLTAQLRSAGRHLRSLVGTWHALACDAVRTPSLTLPLVVVACV